MFANASGARSAESTPVTDLASHSDLYLYLCHLGKNDSPLISLIFGVVRSVHFGHNLPAKQPCNVPELDLLTNTKVLIDPRVIAEVDRKKPIGVSRTGWVNLLLQKAIASEPEPLARD